MELVDTHCHLTFNPIIKDLKNVLSRAAEKHVTRIVVPAYDLESWDMVEKVANLDGVMPAIGLHPWVAHRELDRDELASRLSRSNAVAVGEIGLDFKVASPDKQRQMDVLRTQLEMARRLDLPVLLHCRGAF